MILVTRFGLAAEAAVPAESRSETASTPHGGVRGTGGVGCIDRRLDSRTEPEPTDEDDKGSFKSDRRPPEPMSPSPGDRVRVTHADVTDEGVLMPSSDAEHLVVKLEGGYNVGVDRADAEVEVLERGVHQVGDADGDEGEVSEIEFDDDLQTVSLISTGGTIASTVDYRTGAVTAQFDAEDVLRAVPELAGRANYRGRVVANILSENMDPSVWQELALAVHEEIEAGADGVVVMHGTDTMQFTASALAFMLDTPVPVVFTGSQRSADRPSSDNVMNAVSAVEAAKADCAEVLVCMHASPSDDHCALHRGTRVRKNHTSRRDAFETVGGHPLGRVDYATGEVSFDDGKPYRRRGEVDLDVDPDVESEVELVKFTPGMDPAAWDYLEGKAGVVVEGTGLGHVHTDLIPRIADLVDDGTTVAMTSQCIQGRVCDRVYDTGRDLLDAGVVEAGDTLPGTAKVKLMWALANLQDPADAMGRDLAGELTEESRPWV
jgi:glutamyl-tRNA(Gln) amidotransferase subunit D